MVQRLRRLHAELGGSAYVGHRRRVLRCALADRPRAGCAATLRGYRVLGCQAEPVVPLLRCWQPRGGPQLVDECGQALALDELHGIVMDAMVRADTVDGYNMGMVQLRGRTRLVLEALQLAGVEGRRKRQHFQRDTAAKRQLYCFIDDTHSAPA